MQGPAVRRFSLGEVRERDLASMVREGESLFVEFKKGIDKGSGFQIAKAAASFANALGGWIFIGVDAGAVQPDWQSPPGDFVDVVRQRLEPHVDPLPSFSAGVREIDARQVGVIRVYESTDTPHILSDGSVVIREPAQDSRARKLGVYEPTPVKSHYELLQLAQRGRDALRGAQGRFRPGEAPLVETVLGLRAPGHAGRRPSASGSPSIVARFAPLTVGLRWQEWCVSQGAVDEVRRAIARWAGDPEAVADPVPFARGFGAEALVGSTRPWTPNANIYVARSGTVAVDAGGLLGVGMRFDLEERSGRVDYHRELTFDEIGELLREVLSIGVDLLAASEHLGRFALHADVFGLGKLFRAGAGLSDHAQGSVYPVHVPLGGEITVGADDARGDVNGVAGVWTREILRSCGVAVWS